MCQLFINSPIEAIYFAGKRGIRFSLQVIYIGSSNLHKLTANHTVPVFVNLKSLIRSITDYKT